MLTIGLSCIVPSLVYCAVPNDYTNGNNLNNISSSKIINYIEGKRSAGVGNVYVAGQDKIFYYETFFDEERDYEGLPLSQRLTQNSALSESQKKLKGTSIKVCMTHDPMIYDNAAPVDPMSGKWVSARIVWDGTTNKWKVEGDNIFNDIPDTKRGSWQIVVAGEDSTGKPSFDKMARGYANFRVHKAPVAKMNVTASGNTLTLSDHGSYDVDYQYSKPNNGIAKYEWSVKLPTGWVSAGEGKVIYYNTGGQVITDYRLTVTDYDGAKASVSKSAPPLEKPIADFYHYVGGNATEYVLRGNVGHERVSVKDNTSWNDEAYVSTIYTTSGNRRYWFQNMNGAQGYDSATAYSNYITGNLASVLDSSKRLFTGYEASNKFDLTNAKYKYCQVRDIQGNMTIVGDAMIGDKFIPGSNITVTFRQQNTNIDNDEIELTFFTPGTGPLIMVHKGNGLFTVTGLLDGDSMNVGGVEEALLSISSRRDGSLLSKYTSSISSEIPLSIAFVGTQWYTPGSYTHINVETNSIAESVKITLFKDTAYEQKDLAGTLYTTIGDKKYWTIRYTPPANIPLKVYKASATALGPAGTNISTEAPMHYIDLSASVYHTPDWEANRQKYNTVKSGNPESPRTPDIFFNGERFMLSSGSLSSLPGEFVLNSVKVNLINPAVSTTLSKSSGLFTGDMFETRFKDLWAKPGKYPLTFRFTGNFAVVGDVVKDVTVYVDSTDEYWRQHLKD